MAHGKKIITAFLGLAVIGLILLSFRPEPVPVSAAEVERGSLTVTIDQEGRARVRDRYDLASPVTAYAPRITFDVGDPVKQGQKLIRLLPQPPSLLDRRSREQAQAAVAEARARRDFARQELASAQEAPCARGCLG